MLALIKRLKMLLRYNGFNRKGIPQKEVDKRFQYFLHYWKILKIERKYQFIQEVKFESHLSLLSKIEKQIKYNFKSAFSNINFLFVNHQYFSESNPLLKTKKVNNLVVKLNLHLNPSGIESRDNRKQIFKQEGTRSIFLKKIEQLRKILTNKNFYSFFLVDRLIKEIGTNSPIDENFKQNIKFLTNSFISLLYDFGYSAEYIFEIPNIITFNSALNKFPFEKVRNDFTTKTEFENYANKERQKMTLTKTIGALKNLLNRKYKTGYYIFKISDFCLENPKTVKIGNVEFYNPQLIRKIKQKEYHTDEEIKRIEYFSPEKKIDKNKVSKCNALVQTSIIDSNRIESPKELYDSFQQVKDSLSTLNHLSEKYSKYSKGNGFVEIDKFIRLFDDKTINTYNLGIFNSPVKHLNIDDKDYSKYFKYSIKTINTLDQDIDFQKTLFRIKCEINKYKEEDNKFNFKELWILWDSLLSYEEFVQLIKNSIYIKLEINFIVETKVLLSNILDESHYLSKNKYFTLDKKQQKKHGLNFPYRRIIPTNLFVKQFEKINETLEVEIIDEISKNLKLYLTEPRKFYEVVNNWIESSIKEIYIQRNMEVHHSFRDNLSRLRLKSIFMLFSEIASSFLIENIDKRNPKRIDLALRRVEKIKNKKRR